MLLVGLTCLLLDTQPTSGGGGGSSLDGTTTSSRGEIERT